MRAILGFNGLTDVTFIHVEGQKIGPEAAEAGMARARSAVNALTGQARAA